MSEHAEKYDEMRSWLDGVDELPGWVFADLDALLTERDALAARVRELEAVADLARAAWATYRGEPTRRLLVGDMKRLADALTPEEPKP